MSDLHLECHQDGGKSFINSLNPAGVDVLVLAGDIISAKNVDPLYRIADKYAKVLFVAGNHCFWGSNVSKTIQRLSSLDHPNLIYLNKKVAEIDGKRFLGTTLWFSELEVNKTGMKESWLNDFIEIHGFKPWVYKEHLEDRKWLMNNVKNGDIVITHHLPSYSCIAPEWRGKITNCFFASSQEDIMCDNNPSYWFFGHTHSSVNKQVYSTKTICNPFGYARYGENPNFNHNMVIEI